MHATRALLPEWTSLDAIMLAWPHIETDWSPWLEAARNTYVNVIAAINRYHAGVILLCAPQDIQDVKSRLADNARVLIVPASYNDTWVRDYGFLTCGAPNSDDTECVPVEFRFNGWGEKFDATQDNMANQRYFSQLCQAPMHSSPVVMEGGALEIDENGHLITTSQCLLNPKRNGAMSLERYAATLREMLGCKQVTVLTNGHLEGDDTDGHIDTLVRFTPNRGLVIQAADNRPDDSHHPGLTALCEECSAHFPEHQQFRLPLPQMYNEEGERLPASYANFLICNRAVLLPVYGQPEDSLAIDVIQRAFPDHIVEPIDCSVLVRQFGSLHCISMQVPVNTLKPEIVSALQQGVTFYDIQHD
ncbi:agmatine deiminase family protein [Alteromonas halophila]|uniref:Agmatine deiminase n=1 Tax=Alteromonas halophila TaxID=516698 RepID=A0A918JLF2_9ALTE|nr:agmatine deiminase family protein [Alteromonas halophila]GGW83404.1 agmatine deiminase [Alteromonas halophila]